MNLKNRRQQQEKKMLFLLLPCKPSLAAGRHLQAAST
jgi:hypothetical protein